MRGLLILSLLGLAGSACSEDKFTICNGRELRELLTAGRRVVSSEPLAAQRGCGPTGCSIELGGVAIDREKGLLLDLASKKTIQIQPQVAGDLPELDREPLGGFAISSAGKRWGSCLEFSHAGLGKSGRYQRWTSVVLVPWLGSHPAGIAYRLVGYWAGCDLITAGDKAGAINLPVIEQNKDGKEPSLQLVWHACTDSDCESSKDPRGVREDEDSETGALIITQKP